MVFIAGAQAVHDTGYFQLDGDAQQATVPAGRVGGKDDWDKICAANLAGASNPTGCSFVSGRSVSATTLPDKSQFVTDGFIAASDNIFKGGTDDAEISTWQWKQASPSPDKADIEQAFAAQYTCTQAHITAGDCTSTYLNHKLLFFGGTRYANDGNTNIGLWFFHSAVGTGGDKTAADGSCPVQSGCGFTGSHTAGNCSLVTPGSPCTPGDIFILSAFTGGGSFPTIKAFEWVGANNATKNYNGSNGCFTNACTLQPLNIPLTPGFTDNRCDGPAVSGDVACAITNTGDTLSPWPFTPKSGTANSFADGELFEGGVDLTGLNLGGACFSSFLLNTRSSQSGTSVLQDFALGGFGKCTTTVTTQQSGNSSSIDNGSTAANGTASPGTDAATINVQGAVTWGGTVKFYLCGPLTSGQVCSDSGTSAGVLVNTVTISQATTQPISSATTAANGGDPHPATLTSAGNYCWFVTFKADAASKANGVPDGDDHTGTPAADPASECFTVAPVTPTLPTTAGATVNLGSAVTDSAALSGAAKEPGSNGATNYPTINATNGAFAGKLQFTLKGPDGQTGTNCTDNATPFSGETQTFPIEQNVTGNTTYNVSYKPGSPGKYHWVAKYNGPGTAGAAINNVLPQTYNGNCTIGAEDVTVQQLHTTTVTKPTSDSAGQTPITTSVALGTTLYDLATVTGETGGGNPTGSVTFTICDPGQVTGTAGNEVCVAANGTQVGSAVPVTGVTGSSPPKSTAVSTPGVNANKAGVWCFSATFTPTGSIYTGTSGDSSHTECVVVNPETTTTVTTPSKTSGISINDTVTDHAVVTAFDSADGTPTGTITFYICSPLTTTGSAGNETCAANTGVLLSSGQATAVASSSPPASELTSNSVTATMVGVWCFRAEYLPGGTNGANYLASSDARHSECFTVTDSTSGTSAQKWVPNDHATISSTGGSPLQGTVSMTLHSGTCDGPTVYTEGLFTSPAAGWTSPKSFDTTNAGAPTGFTVDAAHDDTPYFWRIVFTSSNTFVTGTTKCEKTDITVTDNP
jgi:hypothetical protein